MKKKIFSVLVAVMMIVPCLLLSACGGLKSLDGKTLIFSKVEVTGAITKDKYENDYKLQSFEFSEDVVTFTDGTNDPDYYNYKLEGGKVYIKAETDDEYPEEPFAEIFGDYMVVSQTVEGGVVKVYYKQK